MDSVPGYRWLLLDLFYPGDGEVMEPIACFPEHAEAGHARPDLAGVVGADTLS